MPEAAVDGAGGRAVDASADGGRGAVLRAGGVRRRVARWGPAAVGALLGVLALWPALGPGFVLRYDMVFVPDPPLVFPASGFPRAVPSDQVVAALAAVLPAELVQKGVLLGIFVLGAAGAGALVPRDRVLARLATAAFYAWNAYLAQRLLLGQWALLLGLAGLPWAVRAARGRWWHLALALLPAAVGGFQAMLVTAPAVLAVSGWRRPRGLALLAVFSLPWAVPALLAGATTDPRGVDAFAARADGPFGTLGSLLSLGGIWNAAADVPGQGSWLLAAARLVLAAVAVAAYVALRRGWGGAGAPGGERPAYWAGLLVAASAGLAVACAGAFAPGAVRALIGLWPGFGPLRDGQAYLAPLVLLEALGFGAAVAGITMPVRPAALAARGAALLVPVLVLPTFAFGAFGRLTAVEYPGEWRRVQAIVNADPAPGALLTLPWGAYRAFRWNPGGGVVLDPATKLFARRVIRDDSLPVRLGDGRVLRLAAEDPRARRVGRLLGAPGGRTAALRAEGIRYVLILRPYENVFLYRLPEARIIFGGREVLLLRL
ncbi:putative membrane protein YiaA [Thermocatellispora tengchongensis]|uniref:Putative membrane protein YiaA n=1 Tax=Thermocatellispora tengchongensis TaxID=1073253 RepID=A0A840PBS3_9ACTN|nr:hypothetical protein [Thermocatellispora tengchongensis]MBB5134880.1 putative membrane protein YiaA [Thermocatellispora tengchongensis]